MQNYLGFSDSIKTRGAFYQPLGDSKTSFVDTRDIAAVAVEALTKGREHENKAYSITGPEAVSNYEIANILSNIIDRKVTYVNISDDDARKAMKENGMQEWTINSLMELANFQKAGKASVISADVERVTGYKYNTFSRITCPINCQICPVAATLSRPPYFHIYSCYGSNDNNLFVLGS